MPMHLLEEINPWVGGILAAVLAFVAIGLVFGPLFALLEYLDERPFKKAFATMPCPVCGKVIGTHYEQMTVLMDPSPRIPVRHIICPSCEWMLVCEKEGPTVRILSWREMPQAELTKEELESE